MAVDRGRYRTVSTLRSISMIKYVTAGQNLMASVNGGTPYFNMSNPSAGMMRYNANNQYMEVYDGNVWLQVSSGIDLNLTPDANSALEWAKKKMIEERRIDELCKKYPGLGKARDNFETFLRLVESEESVPNS